MIGGLRHENALNLVRSQYSRSHIDELDAATAESCIKTCSDVESIVLGHGRVGSELERHMANYKCQMTPRRVWCVGIQLFMDGVSVVRNSKTSVLAMKCSIINLPRAIKNSFPWIWEIVTLPDTKEMSKMILSHLVKDLLELQRGLKIGDLTIVGYLSLITADSPERSRILGISHGIHRCQICSAAGIQLFQNFGISYRPLSDFSSPLMHLKLFFDVRFHLPHDIMHLEVLRLGRYLIEFLSCTVDPDEIERISKELDIHSVFFLNLSASDILSFLLNISHFLPIVLIKSVYTRFVRAKEVLKTTVGTEADERKKCWVEIQQEMRFVPHAPGGPPPWRIHDSVLVFLPEFLGKGRIDTEMPAPENHLRVRNITERHRYPSLLIETRYLSPINHDPKVVES
ncbi:hypothetical protein ADUPG1_000572 [Aduncisulcus paluster]|uniref:Maturase n=1 Tax=Aduncisulcus paluster TaxID=2918883 RepID=A0ABQ5KAU4_9EUKA|nr:hypothetical protein ADUPG1_000572 [Aduncisulcus paluster]